MMADLHIPVWKMQAIAPAGKRALRALLSVAVGTRGLSQASMFAWLRLLHRNETLFCHASSEIPVR